MEPIATMLVPVSQTLQAFDPDPLVALLASDTVALIFCDERVELEEGAWGSWT